MFTASSRSEASENSLECVVVQLVSVSPSIYRRSHLRGVHPALSYKTVSSAIIFVIVIVNVVGRCSRCSACYFEYCANNSMKLKGAVWCLCWYNLIMLGSVRNQMGLGSVRVEGRRGQIYAKKKILSLFIHHHVIQNLLDSIR